MHQSISSYMISLFCECSLFLLFVKGFWKPFVHPLNLSVLPLQYKGRTHDGSIRLGEHTVLLEASKPLLSPVPHQREMPGLAQVSLAASSKVLGSVVVGNKRVLKRSRCWLYLGGPYWPGTSLAPLTTSVWGPLGSRIVTALMSARLQPGFATYNIQ